jgi:uncharacterized protein (TIGR00369 family)
MDINEHYRKLERMYLRAPINEFYKPEIKISHKQAEIIIKVRKDFFHAANALHGSVYFKLADDSAFFAANSFVTDVFVLTANYNINLLKPVLSGELIAIGKVIKDKGRLIIAQSEVYNDNSLVAKGEGKFLKSNYALSSIENYA